MASATIDSKRSPLKFVWKFDSVWYNELTQGLCSPTMTAVDSYNGTKYTGNFKFEKSEYYDPTFSIDIKPDPGTIRYYFYFNEDLPTQTNVIKTFTDCRKLCIHADVIAFRHQPYQLATPLFGDEAFNLSEKLKQLWYDDSSVKFTIKCKGATIEAIKPIMAACSPVFKAMFDREWKESTGNSVEITDFDPEVVEKMVTFCENGTLVDFEKYEDLYKIADKYDIPELMQLALAKFVETMTIENVGSRLQMAKETEMEELKKWCIIFYAQNGIFDF